MFERIRRERRRTERGSIDLPIKLTLEEEHAADGTEDDHAASHHLPHRGLNPAGTPAANSPQAATPFQNPFTELAATQYQLRMDKEKGRRVGSENCARRNDDVRLNVFHYVMPRGIWRSRIS